MNHLPFPALVAVRHKEEEAFNIALKEDVLSEISTADNFIEDYDYVVSCEQFHWFQNRFDNHFIKCPLCPTSISRSASNGW